MSDPILNLGASLSLDGTGSPGACELPASHLTTHAAIVGMTGSGKTGMAMVLVEEAARNRVPVLVVDIKGDLPDLLLAFPDSTPERYLPWIDPEVAAQDGLTPIEAARRIADDRESELRPWFKGEPPLRAFANGICVRVLTPGSSAGEALHVLSSLERRSELWDSDEEAARSTLAAAISLVLRMVGREADPTSSREHVLLAVLAERRLRAGQRAGLSDLLAELETPPITHLGAMDLDAFLAPRERQRLAAALNALLASPTFEAWRHGAALDVGAWMKRTNDGRTPVTIVSVAHLDDDERALVLGMLLEDVLAWVRTLPGSSRLRGLVVFDEVYGFLPPHPANPLTKRPLVSLLKQARAFGVGVVVATQNPMDLDYRALSNAGLWLLGRLQTDADRERVIDGLMGAGTHGRRREPAAELNEVVKRLGQRWFVMHDAREDEGARLVHVRPTYTWMRGPMTRAEIRRAVDAAGTAGAPEKEKGGGDTSGDRAESAA